MIKISVVVATFNGESTIRDCLNSILKQDFDDFELVVVDDGSSDATGEIVNSFTNQNIRVFRQKNQGLISALNFGLSQCRGDFIARIDDDDVMLPGRLSQQYAYMTKFSLDIIGGGCYTIDFAGYALGKVSFPVTHNAIVLALSTGVPFAHPTVMFRRSFCNRFNLKYGSGSFFYAEDYDLWLKFYKCGARFGNLGSPVIMYRTGGNGLSKRNRVKILSETMALSRAFIESEAMALESVFKSLITEKRSSQLNKALADYLIMRSVTCRIISYKDFKEIPIWYLLRAILGYVYRYAYVRWS